MLTVCKKLLLHSHNFWQVMSHIVLAPTMLLVPPKLLLFLTEFLSTFTSHSVVLETELQLHNQ